IFPTQTHGRGKGSAMTVAEHTAPTGELGRARTRVEDRRLVTGHGRFVEDVYLPGTLQMAVVRCPHPHARIVRIDAAAARALADGAPLVYPEYGSNVCYTAQRGSGDVDAAFASASHTVSLRVRFARIAPAPLEPRGVLAHYDPATEELTVWLTTQSPSGAREQ